ncbi:MAG: hypothetical protein A2015_01840 [Spirochaetes bacterium GWF1_31_7]|nr:MAG: hypothetical protein A2Y30_00790 [Spirochaetes bacterium GWE1_32_154]OHD45949.1 MAG: hypothetical protein A2Y29_16635 [Spirochaetes bacterium GWE2_31_10]OHD48114.1 MAG: hypothetical protein A2015_01840 [Spirochaetes bacterium GWF1_31_7]OHD80413.1 MAG: hypothetical protein A2355_13090 [Spirochaetes bacterium RIFOXYB1_FULL_32_8]HBD95816.1 cysteine hydrolase [Spirochaetia bacterium]
MTKKIIYLLRLLQKFKIQRVFLQMALLSSLFIALTGCESFRDEIENNREEVVIERSIDMDKSALLVIDIQNDYFNGGKYALANSEEASVKAQELLQFYREKGHTIVHIKHINKGLVVPFFAENSDGAKIHKNVTPLDDEKVITKYVVDSFSDTDLDDFLKSKKITDMVVCGMQTNVCVQTASLTGQKKGYNLSVVHDAVAARTEKIHLDTLEMLGNKNIMLRTVADIVKTH